MKCETWGVALVATGALLLIIAKLTGLTRSNWVLSAAILTEIIGLIVYIVAVKKREKY